MNNYFFYNGTNPEYIRIMRDRLKLQPSLKTQGKIKQKIETMSLIQQYCRSDIGTDYLTRELNKESNAAFYIEDKKQTILGVIVFKINDAINDQFFDVPPMIYVHAFCTPFASTGNGRKLMNMVIRFGKIIGAEVIQLSAAYNSVGFYQKFGFTLGLHDALKYGRMKDYNATLANSLGREGVSRGMNQLPFFKMEFHYARHPSLSKSTISRRSATIFNTRLVKRRTRKTRSV